ncbi:MAG: T9SS type A sorting domain-containing protein [Phycisphaerae bacterium]|nr:T9SS type A sorting domain-containing protein [Saprospiraceae bacterium]
MIGAEGRYELPLERNISFRGRCLGSDNSQVLLTVTSHFLRIKIIERDSVWFVESARMNSAAAADDQIMLYANTDVRQDKPSGSCGLRGITSKTQQKLHEPGGPDNLMNPAPCVEYELDLVADGALLWYFSNGIPPDNVTVSSLAAAMISVTLATESLWSPFHVNFIVSGVTIFNCQNNECLPWDDASGDNDGEVLLGEFSDWSEDNLGVHDVAQLWTGRNYQVDGHDAWGLAYIDGVCDETLEHKANWCEWDVNSWQRDQLSAHENGHNFDAGHDDIDLNLIMSPEINDGWIWSPDASGDIIETINDFDCLTPCGTICPDSRTMDGNPSPDYYEANYFITSTATIAPVTTFDAGQYIVLKPGFYTGPGFNAVIGGCGENLQPGTVENRSASTPQTQLAHSPDGIMTVSPNPFTDRISIRATIGEPGPASLLLFDLSRRLVQTIDCLELAESGQFETELQTTGLPAGFYLLQLQYVGGWQAVKLVKTNPQ